MSGWQPIETAPKNRKGLLLYYPPFGRHTEFIAISLGTKDDSSWKPTHWMPLPDPPAGWEGKK